MAMVMLVMMNQFMSKFDTPYLRVYKTGFSLSLKYTRPSCSKLTMSLVNISLKFQMLMSEI